MQGAPICSFVGEFGYAPCLVTAYFKWFHDVSASDICSKEHGSCVY
jgi:hypothetical protein